MHDTTPCISLFPPLPSPRPPRRPPQLRPVTVVVFLPKLVASRAGRKQSPTSRRLSRSWSLTRVAVRAYGCERQVKSPDVRGVRGGALTPCTLYCTYHRRTRTLIVHNESSPATARLRRRACQLFCQFSSPFPSFGFAPACLLRPRSLQRVGYHHPRGSRGSAVAAIFDRRRRRGGRNGYSSSDPSFCGCRNARPGRLNRIDAVIRPQYTVVVSVYVYSVGRNGPGLVPCANDRQTVVGLSQGSSDRRAVSSPSCSVPGQDQRRYLVKPRTVVRSLFMYKYMRQRSSPLPFDTLFALLPSKASKGG